MWENLESTKGTTGDQSSRKFTIPGWNSMVKPFQVEAKFWHSLWVSAGKPINSSVPGVQHELYRLKNDSRNQYHFAVRRAQHSHSKIENDKLVSKIGSPDMFDEIKKSCKNKKSELSAVIDEVHGSQNIRTNSRRYMKSFTMSKIVYMKL